MKKIQTLISAGAVAAVTALPVFAQQANYTTTRMGDESAEQIAQRVGACGEAGITAANFDTDELIRVRCAGGAGGLEGGLGTGAAIGGAIAAVALIGLASDGSDTTTTTTTTTTGTTN
ncbi:hypothetical protein [Yoonia sp.]|uniref:Secreted protein n=1 Tax=Spiribacter salinus TaxID=1335746 RepID=A0A540VNL1_9GAMM|nr:MAG: hypothetical protein FKY71_14395 [Spiribacter salinus]